MSAVFLVAFVTIAVVSHRIIADEASRSTQYILHGTISDIEKPLNEVEIATQTVGAYMTSMMDRPQMLQLIASRTVELNDLIVGCAVIFVNPDGSCNPERTPVFSFLDGAAGANSTPTPSRRRRSRPNGCRRPSGARTDSGQPPTPPHTTLL
ncbi:MAG: hypothetical protein II120_06380 [Bacteroidales bacterium]|nr:hypothetical protein [Bacteroidales bacterium]